MDNWTKNVLLPSLYDRYLKRDPKYVGIIVSDKVADLLNRWMQDVHHYGTWATVTTGRELDWQGRHVLLTKHGRHNIVCFSHTQDEQDAIAISERERQLAREIDDIKTAVVRARAGRTNAQKLIDRTRRDAIAALENYEDDLQDPETPQDQIALAKMMILHYKTIIDIISDEAVK